MLSGLLDFSEKTLHIAIAKDKGIIYNPELVDSYETARHLYDEFMQGNEKYTELHIQTEQGPGELVHVLEKEFKVENPIYVGGVCAPFDIKSNNAEDIINTIQNNPQKYYDSEEKKMFKTTPSDFERNFNKGFELGKAAKQIK